MELKNFNNEDRRIGIELEFYGLKPIEATMHLKAFFEDETKEEVEINEKTVDLVELKTKHGTYRLETDAVFLKKLSEEQKEDSKLSEYFKGFFTSITSEFVPTELVTPPLDISDIPMIVRAHKLLSKAGAKGTSSSMRFAFGAQLNPEVTSMNPLVLLEQMRAFMILSDWLKDQIKIDLSRKLTFFAADFSKEYMIKIFATDYKPTITELIDDYLEFNPTRNRALDMLQLFAHIDEDKVRSVVKNQKIKPRPTFHYRLPNSQMSKDSWNIDIEWRRWLLIEKLAADTECMKEVSKAFRDRLSGEKSISNAEWLIDLNNFVERLR